MRQTPPLSRRLEDDSQLIVYRLLLCYDVFKQHRSLSNFRNVNGCCMMPMGSPPSARKSSAFARLITFCHYGQNMTVLIKIIVDDIVHGSKRCQRDGPVRAKVTFYMDPMVHIGHNFSIKRVSSSMGQLADACCTACQEVRWKSGAGSALASKIFVRSHRMAQIRTDDRLIPSHGQNRMLGGRMQIRLVLQSYEASDISKRSIVWLLEKLLQKIHNKLCTDAVWEFLTTGLFKSSLSTAACLNYSLTCLIKAMVDVCFSGHRNRLDKHQLETNLVVMAGGNNLSSEGNIVKWERRAYASLFRMTIILLFKSLFCFAHWFLEEVARDFISAVHPLYLISLLQEYFLLRFSRSLRNKRQNFVKRTSP